MYAFISNEYKTIVYTQRKLEFLLSIYSYPKFVKVESEEEANKFFNSTTREYIRAGFDKFGRTNDTSYIRVEFFIDKNNIYINVDTSKFGFIQLNPETLDANLKQDASYDLLKLKIMNVNLNDNLIADHCTAMLNILRLIPPSINIDFILRDISVYLACTQYRGTNYTIKRIQSEIKGRIGDIYYTLK